MVEEFKRGMNGGIRRKLMEVENLLASIKKEQWPLTKIGEKAGGRKKE